MSNESMATYYRQILKVLDASSEYYVHYWLYADLKLGEDSSPESRKILIRYYENSMARLKDSMKEAKDKQKNMGRTLVSIMTGLGIYNYADAKVWCSLVECRREDCDFRQKMRDWCRSELKKIETGKSSDVPLSFSDFISKWNKLEKQREERRLKKYPP